MGPRKVAGPCGERRMHCSGEGCPKQSIGSARLKRRLRPTSVGSLGHSPKPFLHPFVGTKGCPRRVGVQTMISKRLSPPEVIANYHLNIPPQVVRPAPVFTSAASHTRLPAARPAPGSGQRPRPPPSPGSAARCRLPESKSCRYHPAAPRTPR